MDKMDKMDELWQDFLESGLALYESERSGQSSEEQGFMAQIFEQEGEALISAGVSLEQQNQRLASFFREKSFFVEADFSKEDIEAWRQ